MIAFIKIGLGFAAAIVIFGALLTIADIGKPRKSTTGGVAVGTVIISSMMAWSAISAIQHL